MPETTFCSVCHRKIAPNAETCPICGDVGSGSVRKQNWPMRMPTSRMLIGGVLVLIGMCFLFVVSIGIHP